MIHFQRLIAEQPVKAMMFAFVAVLLFLHITECQKMTEICVINSHYHLQNTSCCNGNNSVHINDLSNISSNSVIKLCSRENNLTTVINIERVDNVSLKGTHSNKSSIICHNKSSGFSFKNVSNLTIRDVAFRYCSIEMREAGTSASVSIHNSTGIYIFHITIDNSPGIGLYLCNVSGKVSIQESAFNNNGMKNNGIKNSHGGVHIEMKTQTNSDYTIEDCSFNRNNINYNSSNILSRGGGLSLLLFFKDAKRPLSLKNNITITVLVIKSIFMHNVAGIGGGTSVYASRTDNDNIAITFKNCSWSENKAYFGGAVAIFPDLKEVNPNGYLPKVYFDNITIRYNIIRPNLFKVDKSYTQYHEGGGGAIYCSEYLLSLKGVSEISHNNGSAVYSIWCTLLSEKGTSISFNNNTGYYGGAMYMLSSILIVSDDSEFLFVGNTAIATGGAIHFYMETIIHSAYSSTCYIRNDREGKKTIQFTFRDNKCGLRDNRIGYTNSIQTATLFPCFRDYNVSSVMDLLDKIGNFTFTPNSSTYITTLANRIEFKKNESIFKFIPGKLTALPIKSIDDIGNEVLPHYEVTIQNINNNSNIHTDSLLISGDYNITFFGRPGNQAIVKLATSFARRKVISFKIRLSQCPPGFLLPNKSSIQCECLTKHEQKRYSRSIFRCDENSFTAYVTNGHWLGYAERETNEIDETDETLMLMTGYCPLGYCNLTNSSLPKTADGSELNNFICIKREGVLCGKCTANLSVYYHSSNYTCGSNDICHLGWLFYILSEILPITIAFVVIILFDISLTSGHINSFIFHAQVIEILLIRSADLIPHERPLGFLRTFHRSIYQIFQLKFFTFEKLSFCIWKGAHTLHVICVNYISQLYSVILIIAIILIIKHCKSHRASSRSSRRQIIHLKKSFLHGISAFFVLFYSQTANISILLIRREDIFQRGGIRARTLVHYHGDYDWMSRDHAPYVVISLINLVLIVLLPPTLLLMYPLHYKILALLRLSESKYILKALPLEKLKPLFDSFQSCFKDKYRFFSGLFFFYRFIILLNLIVSNPDIYYTILQVTLVTILIIHLIFRPYKEHIHNVIDCLLLGNLCLINSMTLCQLLNVTNPGFRTVISWLQTALIFLPALVLIIYFALKLKNNLVKLLWKSPPEDSNTNVNDITLEELTREHQDSFVSSYSVMKSSTSSVSY